MFERFTQDARSVVVRAQTEARSLGHGWIGTEHLLLAALSDRAGEVAQALDRLGLDADRVRAAVLAQSGAGVGDADALRDLGIDLDAVRRRAEERFGAGALDPAAPRRVRRWWPAGRAARGGHVRFTPRARKALELSLREALGLGQREIRVAHVVLGALGADGQAARVVARLGVAPADVRRAVLDLGRAA